jgi:phosphate transport system permease protein
VAREPTTLEYILNRAVSSLTWSFAALTIALVGLLLYTIIYRSLPAIQADGLSLVTSTDWNPSAQVPSYGLLPAIVGTVISSALALILGTVLGVAIAIFLTQDFLPKFIAVILKNIVDLLAAIPSVVYGLWGIYVITPMLQPIADWLHRYLGFIPFFGTALGPSGLAPAALVLGIMILPTIAAISRDALAAVHPRIKEAAYGLGATRWEVIFGVMLPTAAGGIFGGVILGFGRALGETMALAMLMGNRMDVSWSLFAPGNTLAALIANAYPEADDDLISRLIFAALVLLVITLIVNVLGTLILQRATRQMRGAK